MKTLTVAMIVLSSTLSVGCASVDSYYMSRQEVIAASQECSNAAMLPRVIYAKQAGVNYPVPKEVVCDVRYPRQ